MTHLKQEIINNITKHFRGENYNNIYVGITSDAKKRLFEDHNVSKKNGYWIHRTATSHNIAREVEKYFLDVGMDGGSGGGDESSSIVYAYKKTSYTNP